MNETNLPYQIIRSSRKTIAIQITSNGNVLVRCPSRMGSGEIRKFVESKSHWIHKHLSALRAKPQLPAFTQEEIQELSEKARQIIPERVNYFASQAGVTYGRITIRNQVSRWGSCSSKGSLNFNCLLVLAPPEVLDYVVVHELCHRKELNHSARFWAEVEKLLPDYKIRRKWLKDHENELIGRL